MAQETTTAMEALIEGIRSFVKRQSDGESDIQVMKHLILKAIHAGELRNAERDESKNPKLDEEEKVIFLDSFLYGEDIFYAMVDVYKAAVVVAEKRTEGHSEAITVLKQASSFAGKALTSQANPKGLKWSPTVTSYIFRIDPADADEKIIGTLFEKLAPTVEGTLPDVTKATAIAEGLLARCKLAEEAAKPIEMNEEKVA